ncbi:MAG: hypothetical protein C5B46_09215 [Proteobacteria bacterium]|nr:MAG: hypothetical protein C5B46_09215 [Pseudomonadota bacterium]
MAASPAGADRITELRGTELCVYKAQLSVAGFHYFRKGTPRAEVPIRWHGDETQYEIEFITRTLDEAYATAEEDRREHPDKPSSEQAFGDRIYNQCVAGN